MARPIRALDIWMNGERVGVWQPSRVGNSVFEYDDDWRQSERGRPISLSLPFLPGNEPHRGEYVEAWFDNLLPDSDTIRTRLSQRFHTSSRQPFELLAAIGRDCVGAVQIMPTDADPGNVRRIDSEPLTEADVAALLRRVTVSERFGADVEDEIRISIAGAQEKTALVRIDGRWHRPHGATPTTHILKLPLGVIGNMRADMHESVENEWLCLEFLRRLGLPAASASIETFADDVGQERVLVLDRFDREFRPAAGGTPAWIVRLPQEDFCQATGVPSSRKYENEGGPGIRQSLALLAAGERRAEDSLVFIKAQVAFWLLAAPDGHAKNFSIFLRRNGYVMTPLYDVLSAWPVIGKGPNKWAQQDATLAMAVRGHKPHRHINEIATRHWRALSMQAAVSDAFQDLLAMVESADAVLDDIESALPTGFPGHVWSSISKGVRSQRERFLRDGRTIGEPTP